MEKEPFHFSRFWTTDNGLTALLVFIILFFIALNPLYDYPFGKVLVLVFFSLLLITGVMTVIDRPVARIIVGGLAAVALIFVWLKHFLPAMLLASVGALASFMCLGLLVALTLTRVFQKGPITFHRVCGAIAAYLLIGAMWASLYQFIHLSRPGAIDFPPQVDVSNAEAVEPHLFYFSFVTLTTLGYGDIVPVHPGARLAALFEALTGQLYPAITLAWLISMEILTRSKTD